MSYRIRERCMCGAEFEAEGEWEAQVEVRKDLGAWQEKHPCTVLPRVETNVASAADVQFAAAFARKDLGLP